MGSWEGCRGDHGPTKSSCKPGVLLQQQEREEKQLSSAVVCALTGVAEIQLQTPVKPLGDAQVTKSSLSSLTGG